VSALGAGSLLAAVLAGPPLYSLVQAGSITWTTAAGRGALVAAACTAGAAGVGRLARSYERTGSRARTLAAADQAIADTRLVHEGRTIPSQDRPADTR
jgi:hypothetical protein